MSYSYDLVARLWEQVVDYDRRGMPAVAEHTFRQLSTCWDVARPIEPKLTGLAAAQREKAESGFQRQARSPRRLQTSAMKGAVR